MYTLCYVLVDDQKKQYCNQLMISLASIKRWSPKTKICVLMDKETLHILQTNHTIQEIENMNAELVLVDVPVEYSQMEKSRYLKTTLREHLIGDILYIDTDTVIADNLPEDISEFDIAMVQDKNWKQIDKDPITAVPESNRTVKFRLQLAKQCGYTYDYSYKYFNSGVIWARDTPQTHEFFRKWHEEWKKCRNIGISRDQPALNAANHMFGYCISELDGIWNVQVACPMSLRYIDHAIILHYFNFENVYKLSTPSIQHEGYNGETVKEILSNPKMSFYPFRLMPIEMIDEELMYSTSYILLKQLRMKHTKIYHVINNIDSFLIKLKQFIFR